MCCGQKRSAMMRTPKPANVQGVPENVQGRSVSLRYLKSSPIQLRGPVTGLHYQFSTSHPIQGVDPRDAEVLMGTHFFSQT
jgi:hypothetical protein